MNIKPATGCEEFDLYTVGSNRELEGDIVGHGFSGMALSLSEAQAMAHSIRQRGWATIVVPTNYHRATLTRAEARDMAIQALESIKAGRVNETFGDLDVGADEGGWWLFEADNLTAQDAGMIPGLMIIRVDKLLRRPLSREESQWVDVIQTSSS